MCVVISYHRIIFTCELVTDMTVPLSPEPFATSWPHAAAHMCWKVKGQSTILPHTQTHCTGITHLYNAPTLHSYWYITSTLPRSTPQRSPCYLRRTCMSRSPGVISVWRGCTFHLSLSTQCRSRATRTWAEDEFPCHSEISKHQHWSLWGTTSQQLP